MSSRTLRVPASSANLGPGFDALAMALTLYLDFTFEVDPQSNAQTDVPSNEGHLAVRTFRAEGGIGAVSVAANFAGGRGLGFSGAARVAGCFAARLQAGEAWDDARSRALARAANLEGHADNVGASVVGGVVAVALPADNNAEHESPVPLVVSVPNAIDATVVVWIPQAETSTKQSRTLLPSDVAFNDAVFNLGRASLLVAAFAAGDSTALRAGTSDRLHQGRRFERVPDSRAAYETMLDRDVLCAWLSGSGPTVAALCDRSIATSLSTVLPSSGRTVICDIDNQGTRYI